MQLKLITLLLVVCLAAQQRIVGCNTMKILLESVRRMVVELEVSFDEHIRADLINKVIREGQNFPLLLLATEVAESEAIVQTFQRRALTIASNIIYRNFIENKDNLSAILQHNEFLFDLITRRMVVQSLRKGLVRTENYRKKIFLLTQRYGNYPDVLDLSHMYFLNIRRIREKESAAMRMYDDSLSIYRGKVPFFWSTKTSEDTITAIDELITKNERLSDRRVDELEVQKLIKKHAGLPRLVAALDWARKKMFGKIDDIDTHSIESVNINDVQLYEESVVREYEVIRRYSERFDARLERMETSYQESMEVLLHQPKQGADNEQFRYLRALSPIMAEAEALMYADERKMLLVIKRLFDRHPSSTFRILTVNEKLLDFVVDSLNNYALARTLEEDMSRRKKIFKLSEVYEYKVGVKRLASEYFKRVNRRKELEKTFKDSEKNRKDNLSAELSPEVRPILMKSVDDLVRKGIELWLADPNPANTLDRLDFDPLTRRDIRWAKGNTHNDIVKVYTRSVHRIDQADVDAFEVKLLNV